MSPIQQTLRNAASRRAPQNLRSLCRPLEPPSYLANKRSASMHPPLPRANALPKQPKIDDIMAWRAKTTI